MGHNNLINIELVFASEQEQVLLKITVVDGTSARDAVLASHLATQFPNVNFAECPLGIWGRAVDDSRPLREGDRVEAYRHLIRDPRDARRELALAGRSMGKSS